MEKVTFVTALYDISREKYDGRSYKQYQEWFKRTLTIPVNMVIYTDKKNENIVNEIRKNLPTKLIVTELEDVPFYYTRDKVEHIIKNTEFKNNIMHKKGLENICFDYIPIVNSKFVWMSESIKNNYFNTEMFFWIDAGLSRFFHFDISKHNFNYNLINDINKNNKIFIQVGKEKELFDVLNNNTTLDVSIGKNINFTMGGFWGGNSDLLKEICDTSAKMYIDEYINKERVDNEQVLFSFTIKNYINNLCLVGGVKDCYNYYVFTNNI